MVIVHYKRWPSMVCAHVYCRSHKMACLILSTVCAQPEFAQEAFYLPASARGGCTPANPVWQAICCTARVILWPSQGHTVTQVILWPRSYCVPGHTVCKVILCARSYCVQGHTVTLPRSYCDPGAVLRHGVLGRACSWPSCARRWRCRAALQRSQFWHWAWCWGMTCLTAPAAGLGALANGGAGCRLWAL